ncbi:MAG: Lytic murein transglycosylase [Candidatus Tokpelaia hoelldobleri]|uniref:Lytic murein transglycosylase n=1 Tax=Candidatus Tokpelaia hoelldobleri TaxID=1902579 RepID=A0A1U9JU15_9HYPH|nr:MAG: Lytic murein transglycosylase [Candidatus Tokpelaia hoelldoblerii]
MPYFVKKLFPPHTTGRRQFLFIAGAIFAAAGLPGTAHGANSFQTWLNNFQNTAAQAGITAATWKRAVAGITTPDMEVLQKAQTQPEFTDPAWNYFDNRVNEHTVQTGQAHARQWAKWLDAIEKRFGVSRNILLAIWSMETGYGEVMKRDDIMRDAIRSLATLAWGDSKRARYARTQLIAALKILQRGDIDRAHLRGSWAGALGHTQFIPTSYLAYAVDMDGDGRRNIWTSVPDALASAANLLARNGWKNNETWGYEVILPAMARFPADSLTIAQWRQLGLKRANGRPFPAASQKATLKLPDGHSGPVFLVTGNFFTLKRYNNADRYALAVGLLADRIGGYNSPVRDWQRPFTALNHSERQELQQRLAALGLYSGKIDGKTGNETRRAIEAFQRRMKQPVDGYPGREVLNLLQRR